MTRLELIKAISYRSGYDKETVARVVVDMMSVVKQTVIDGDSVYLRGFGSFTTTTRKATYARNIRKNTACFVPEHKVVHFKPAPDFAEPLREQTENK